VSTVPEIVQPVLVKVPIGTTPTSPVRVEVVHVTAPFAGPPARAEKLAAEPSDGACALHRLPMLNTQITNKSLFIPKLLV
jgi:hypothetical protein